MNFKEMAKELVSKMTLEEKMAQLDGISPAIERLGIPAYYWWNECLHGSARCGTATVFPQSIAMASSFNTELMEEVANAISDEIRAKYNENKKQSFTDLYQGLTMCSPNINMFRDPRWGRGHETYGEDPCLTGKIASAYIKGLQGDGKYRKTDATLKHYAVHSGPEGIRHGFNASVSDDDLFNYYLKAFEYCIKTANPSAVMASYNAVEGEPCSASPRLLKEILRGRFSFSGYVESDVGAIEDIFNHHKQAKDLTEAAAAALNSGCDLCLGDAADSAYSHLGEAYSRGLIDEETITKSAEKLFETRFRLGMFADDCEYDNIPYDVIDCEKHRQLNRKMAQESIVLLKNDGILPLKKDTNIAVIGPNSDNLFALLGNYNGTPSHYSTLLQGITENANGKVLYARGCDHLDFPRPYSERPQYEAVIAAQKSDVVIMVMGLDPRFEGEESDAYSGSLSGDKPGIELPAVQMDLYNRIKATGKPIIFINVSGSCIALGEQKETGNALIQCFYPGAEGGKAVADILFGNVSPSGRLPVTFYKSTDDLPPFEDYSMKNRTYKFFKGETVYDFGFGLTYSEIDEEWIDENTVQITNKGKYDTAYSVLKFDYVPHKSLADFKKIFIKQGETITVKF